MSDLFILVPIHKTQQKALYNIHKGRDVRTDIPEDETDAFMSLTNNYPVLYEYFINKFPDRFKDGDTISFYDKNKKGEAGKLLAKVSKVSTNFLGEKARVKAEPPKEPPKAEESPKPVEPPKEKPPEPKKEIVSENGAVEAKAEPVRPPPNPTVPLPVEVAKEDAVIFPYYPIYTGETIYIQGRRLKDKSNEAFYYKNWKKYVSQHLQDLVASKEFSFVPSSSGSPFFPVIDFDNPQKSVWGALAIEIADFRRKMKEIKENTATKTGWEKYKYPIPDEILAKRRYYNNQVLSVKNSFHEYLIAKYEILMPDEKPPVKKTVVSDTGAVNTSSSSDKGVMLNGELITFPFEMYHMSGNILVEDMEEYEDVMSGKYKYQIIPKKYPAEIFPKSRYEHSFLVDSMEEMMSYLRTHDYSTTPIE